MRTRDLKMHCRLTNEEIKIIKTEIKKFDPDAKIILFGSRVNNNEKGGDIDLVVMSEKIDFKNKIKLLTEFYKKIGDRTVDLIIANKKTTNSFINLAIKNGIEI